MKKIMIHTKKLGLFFLVMLSGLVYSQATEGAIDKNPVYSIEGTGYQESGSKRQIIFSNLNIEGDNKNEITLNNNEITVKKDGIYRIGLSSEINKGVEKEQQLKYSIHLNNKEAFQSEKGALSLEGKYYFQIQLKSGDTLSFDVLSDKVLSTTSKNNLSIRFTDPKLITFFDNGHH
ncbi:hypothetical protein SAMN05421825_3220 [Epilithonimonas hungarica]|uniref:Uncharacterized protein n=2 Tax=Epilithonimonas hungarica TaxID=454006 RepID=A0A1G7TTW4_9FLAO|nr:hypothetical protein SAMN05421825_3220 [Epilithonimonas hungarica]